MLAFWICGYCSCVVFVDLGSFVLFCALLCFVCFVLADILLCLCVLLCCMCVLINLFLLFLVSFACFDYLGVVHV